MKFKNAAIACGGVFYALTSFVSLLKYDAWWIRFWDFPRLQLLVLGSTSFLLTAFSAKVSLSTKLFRLGIMGLGIGWDLYRIFPYSPFHRIEVQPARRKGVPGRLRLLVSNVLQHNFRSDLLKRSIEESRPDVILLLEVNERWMTSLASLTAEYPYQVVCPLENEYGIALLSRLELTDSRVQFLLEPDIPSIEAKVTLPEGAQILLYGVHPRPPRPDSGNTTARDAELVIVGKKAARDELPVIVFGDLNDVAWSHTSRLFRRISRLLDPRVGRAPFSTFPVYLPFLRFPLDHIFHSDDFRVSAIKRLPDMGSDHFPMFAELFLEGDDAAEQQEAPRQRVDDPRESDIIIQRATSSEV